MRRAMYVPARSTEPRRTPMPPHRNTGPAHIVPSEIVTHIVRLGHPAELLPLFCPSVCRACSMLARTERLHDEKVRAGDAQTGAGCGAAAQATCRGGGGERHTAVRRLPLRRAPAGGLALPLTPRNLSEILPRFAGPGTRSILNPSSPLSASLVPRSRSARRRIVFSHYPSSWVG